LCGEWTRESGLGETVGEAITVMQQKGRAETTGLRGGICRGFGNPAHGRHGLVKPSPDKWEDPGQGFPRP
jgi:hypothetical protein